MKTAIKLLLTAVVGLSVLYIFLQWKGHYSATITPLGDDTQFVVFVNDKPQYQILFEKKATAQSARIAPEKVDAPEWKHKFSDATLAPGFWALLYQSTEIAIYERKIIIADTYTFPAGSSVKVHADGKAERVGQLDPNAPCNQCQMP